jgi:hypothetical protein
MGYTNSGIPYFYLNDYNGNKGNAQMINKNPIKSRICTYEKSTKCNQDLFTYKK